MDLSRGYGLYDHHDSCSRDHRAGDGPHAAQGEAGAGLANILITEYLTSIKAIKYFAWEESMIKHVQRRVPRSEKYLWHITVLITLMHVTTEFIPIIALVLIFSLSTSES